MLHRMIQTYQKACQQIRHLDFLPLLALRVYLAPIFVVAGWQKYQNFNDVAAWFGNAQWGLGLPMPELLLSLTILAEFVGGFALLFGVLTRVVSLSLVIAMLVAIFKVHWQHGWFAITPTNPETSTAKFFEFFGLSAQASLENSAAAAQRLQKAKAILAEHGNYDWLTETGNFVILNNGIEFATTYLIMLLVLLVYGAGQFVSLDYWLAKRFNRQM